jgi:hypothetical protein
MMFRRFGLQSDLFEHAAKIVPSMDAENRRCAQSKLQILLRSARDRGAPRVPTLWA